MLRHTVTTAVTTAITTAIRIAAGIIAVTAIAFLLGVIIASIAHYRYGWPVERAEDLGGTVMTLAMVGMWQVAAMHSIGSRQAN